MNIIIAVLLLIWAPLVSAMDYEPYTYMQDFESHEIMAWSSYPPVQDAAYEAPFIYPGKIVPDEEGTVLCKIIYPQWNAPQLTGVVKRLNMRLDENSRLRFRYYIKTTLTPKWMGIDLPLANGDRVRAKFMSPGVNEWISVDMGLDDILDAAGYEKGRYLDITALALTVRFENADPDMPIMLGFDDVSVSGLCKASFTYEQPRTESLDEWESDIALHHYRHGDELVIEGRFPSSNTDRITAQIVRFDRPESVLQTVRLKKDGNSWITGKKLTLDEKRFPAGMYEVTLRGTHRKKTTAQSSFTFMIMDENRYSEHPRFWFGKSDKEAFISGVKGQKNAAFLDKIRSDAQDARKRLSAELPYDLDTFPTKGWLSSFEPYRTRIATIPQRATANAIVFHVDGDEEAAEWAKDALVSLCKWPTWTHPWMINRGHHIYLYQYYTAYNLALTYDMLYDRLTESERSIVREGLIRNGLKPAFRTYVIADMCTCNESNWITAIVGGALAGVCAVLGETGDTCEFEPYLSGCLYKMKAHMNTVYNGDSANLEGFGYGYGTMRIYSEVLPIIEKNLNIDMSRWLDRQYTEGFWAADHDAGTYFTFGDARTSPPNMAFSPWLIEKFRDPELAWFHDLNPPAPAYYTFHNILYDIDDIPRRRPENLSGAQWFRKTGTVIFRSGPGPDPFVLTFRCGPFGNHQHIDQGTFFLSDRGELLITEQEYSDYYDDPIYQSHVIQPVGHNCILIDHNPQSQRTGDHGDYAAGMTDHAKITQFAAGESMAFALGDLSPVYLGNVRTLERGILYVHPRTAIIIDRLETEHGEATMDALFHGPKYSDMNNLESMFAIQSGNTSLYGQPIGVSSPSTFSITRDPVKLGKYTDDPVEPMGRVTVTTPTKNGKAVTAVVFGEKASVDSHERAVFLSLKKACVMINGSGTDTVAGGIGTDGLCAAVLFDGGFMLADGTYAEVDGITIIKADKPVTIIIEGDTVSYSAAEPATVQIRPNSNIRRVIDDNNVEGWKINEQSELISLKIPAGQGTEKLYE